MAQFQFAAGAVLVASSACLMVYGALISLSPQNQHRVRLWWSRLTSYFAVRRSAERMSIAVDAYCDGWKAGHQAGKDAAITEMRQVHAMAIRAAHQEGVQYGKLATLSDLGRQLGGKRRMH